MPRANLSPYRLCTDLSIVTEWQPRKCLYKPRKVCWHHVRDITDNVYNGRGNYLAKFLRMKRTNRSYHIRTNWPIPKKKIYEEVFRNTWIWPSTYCVREMTFLVITAEVETLQRLQRKPLLNVSKIYKSNSSNLNFFVWFTKHYCESFWSWIDFNNLECW